MWEVPANLMCASSSITVFCFFVRHSQAVIRILLLFISISLFSTPLDAWILGILLAFLFLCSCHFSGCSFNRFSEGQLYPCLLCGLVVIQLLEYLIPPPPPALWPKKTLVMVLPHVMVLARGGAPSRNIFLEIKMDLFHATNIPRLLLDMAQGWPPRGASIERSALPIQVPPWWWSSSKPLFC